MMRREKATKYWVVIPAAGIGSRMQSDRPKQYLSFHNEVILAHVVNLFTAMPEIEKVVVVLNAKDYWWPTVTLAQPEKVLTAIGGHERVHSVLLGLAFLKDYAADKDWVLVHDAARPCITTKDIHRLLKALDGHPVGGLFGLPIVDTIKEVGEYAEVLKTIPRTGLWYAQTPQMFRYKLLRESIEHALATQHVVTDEANAVELSGHRPKMIVGSSRNLKLTFPEDLDLMQKL